MNDNGRMLLTAMLIVLLVTSTLTLIPMRSTGDVIIVDSEGGGDHLYIQDAIDEAKAGDEIQILSGVYEEDVLVDKTLTIEGEKGVVIVDDYYGLKIEADDCNIRNLSIEGSEIGIEIAGDGNFLKDIRVSKNDKGILFFRSVDNHLKGSNIKDCNTGMLFFEGNNNTISDSTVSASIQQGIRISRSDDTTLINNVVKSSGYHSFYLSRSDDVNIFDNHFYDNERGVYIFESFRSSFVNNTLEKGLNIESEIKEGWDSHEMYGNDVGSGKLNYYVDDSAIEIESMSGQMILVNCTGSSIRYNDVTEVESGVTLAYSSDNSLYGNDLRKNHRGVDIFNSENNTFHHNNFLNNTFQVHSIDESSGYNSWTDGMGNGNHWSDYSGYDDGSGGRTSEDGVGDTEIPHPSVDKGYGYDALDPEPLMEEVLKSDSVIELNNDSNGWNFVSSGIEMGEVELEELFSSIDYEKVMYYSGEDDRWMSYIPSRADHFNDLITLDRSMGFWINVQEQQELNFTGVIPVRTLVEIEPGWNMVGISTIDDVSGSELPSEVDMVGIYNGSREYLIEYLDPSEANLERGKGYWIHNSGDESVVWNLH